MANSPRGISNNELEIARNLRSLLGECQPGDPLPESDRLRTLLDHLEHFLPSVLAELHREWKYESFDGLNLSYARATTADEAELYGLAILIADQSLAPFHVRLQISPREDKVTWMECRVGRRGVHGMERIHFHDDFRGLSKLLTFDQVDWMYQVTFGEHRPEVQPAPRSCC